MTFDHLSDRRDGHSILSCRFGYGLHWAVFQYQEPGSCGRKYTLDGLEQLVLGFSVHVVAVKLLALCEHGAN